MPTISRSQKKFCIALLVALAVIAVFLFSPGSRSNRLLDGSLVMLESVTCGKTHVSPAAKPPGPLRLLPAQWLRSLNWDSGAPMTINQKSDTFVFWLRFNNSKGDQSVRYAIADEEGFEAPIPFSGPHLNYKPTGFGKSKVGHARSFGLLPRRSRKFYLRLYQQDKNGHPVRVANFPVENTPANNVPGWIASSLPISQQTNSLVFALEKAAVGIVPPEKLVPPYDSFPGEWSEFRFRVTEHGKPSSGWNINEIWIYDATGNQLRTSKEDHWSLNGTFSRIEAGEIICTHRWAFWPGEPAWKLRVHFEHETRPAFWAEYFINPNFLH
jgi:hypothetical protein